MELLRTSKWEWTAVCCIAAICGLVLLTSASAHARSRNARASLPGSPSLDIVNRPPVKRLPSASREAKALNAMLAARSGRTVGPKTTASARPPGGRQKAVPARVASSASRMPPQATPDQQPSPAPAPPQPTAAVGTASAQPAADDGAPMTMEAFLDRLMMAESGGRTTAKNPRSTALGPFQFIESTFLSLVRRNFGTETATLSPQQILALRTDMTFSRKAAETYTRENAAYLQANGITPSFPNLRLAFLLGAGGAVRVLQAAPETPLQALLGPAVLVANPFMVTMTAHGLATRSAREVSQPVTSRQGVEVTPGAPGAKRPSQPAVPVFCNLRLPSCKRWLALQTAKARGARKPARLATDTSPARPSAMRP